jgi:glycosyltransferase involved in cell wall biosynthesis
MPAENPAGALGVRALVARAQVVTAPSRATLEDCRAFSGKAGGEWRVVPNMLPADVASLLDEPAGDGDGSVLAVGELHPKKGLDLLIRAVAELDGVTLRIAGEGEQREKLAALANELGVADRVELPGFVSRDRLRALFERATVMAVPSRAEPFGLVILEAFAAGVPVVAARTGGIPEVVGEEGAAVLVPPEDPGKLACALRELLDDPSRRAGLRLRGRDRARGFSPASMARGYLDAYRIAARLAE